MARTLVLLLWYLRWVAGSWSCPNISLSSTAHNLTATLHNNSTYTTAYNNHTVIPQNNSPATPHNNSTATTPNNSLTNPHSNRPASLHNNSIIDSQNNINTSTSLPWSTMVSTIKSNNTLSTTTTLTFSATSTVSISCSCTLAHTLRCDGSLAGSKRDVKTALEAVIQRIRNLGEDESVSLLDLSVQNLTYLPPKLFQGVELRGLVISTGYLTEIPPKGLQGLEDQLTALGLPSNNLLQVPVGPISPLIGLSRLDLSGNKISGLTSLPALPDLEYLDLSRNKIRVLAAGVFQPLSNLKVLSLGENELESSAISYYNLQHLSYLHTIQLNRNQLSGFLRSPLLDLFPSNLRELDLSMNRLEGVQENALLHLTSLTQLNLQGNNIQEVSDWAFRGLARLETLDLSHNSIITLSDDSFAGLTNLDQLILNHNHIQILSGSWLGALSSLSSLELMDNELTSVEEAAFTSLNLSTINLAGNPLNCDCSLSYLHTWLLASKSSSAGVAEESLLSARCATPLWLANAPLVEVPAPLECNKSAESEYYEYYTEPGSTSLLLSSSELHLVASHYSPATGVLSLAWRIDEEIGAYSCGQIHVFQEQDSGVELVSQSSLDCDSASLPSPSPLSSSTLSSSPLSSSPRLLYADLQLAAYRMQPGRPYIVCVSVANDEAVFPGCTGSIIVPGDKEGPVVHDGGGSSVHLHPTEVVVVHPLEEQTGIAGLAVNSSLEGEVSVYLRTTVPRSYRGTCRLLVGVSVAGTSEQLATHTGNCLQASHRFTSLAPAQAYRICAIIQLEDKEVSKEALQSLLDKSEDCALATFPHVRYRDRSLLPLMLALVLLALAIACLTVLYLLLRRRGDQEGQHRRRRYYPLPFVSSFCIKFRRKFGGRGTHAFLEQCDADL